MKAQIFNRHWWLDGCDHSQLVVEIDLLLKQSGFTVLDFVEHHFSPVGYTSLWLLGESHAALHTFPEENKSYLEVSSCVEVFLSEFTASLALEQKTL